jgi:hypothetical protein
MGDDLSCARCQFGWYFEVNCSLHTYLSRRSKNFQRTFALLLVSD